MSTYTGPTLGVLLGLFISLQAEARPDYIWSDKDGLVKAQQCRDSLVDDIPFRVTQFYSSKEESEPQEALRSRSGQIQYYIPNNSLVGVIATKDDTYQVEVVGVSQNQGYPENRYTAKRHYGSDKADSVKSRQNLYIYYRSVEALSDYVFEIKKAEHQFEGSYLKVAMEAEKYNASECCIGDSCTEYYIFDIVSGTNGDVLTQVGVSGEQTEVFKEITGMRVAEFKENLKDSSENKRKQDSSSEKTSQQSGASGNLLSGRQSQNRDSGSGSSETKPAKASAGVVAITVEGPLENVVCLDQRGASLNVRDENQKEVLFQLDNGEKIKVFQSFGEQSKDLGGEEYNFVKIQTVEGGKVGWVAERFVKPAANCASVESDEPAAENTGAPVNTGRFPEREYTVCTKSGGSLSVYDMDFEKLSRGYFLDSGEKVTVIDGTLRDMPTPNGYKYVKVNTESNYTRYVAKDFLTTGKCETAMGSAVNGYIFPTTTKAGYSYIPSGSRPSQHSQLTQFSGYRNNWGIYGARRGGGSRAHAATDLYQPFGLKRPNSNYSSRTFGGAFRAMTNGRVVRGATFFYLGTYYIAVLHDDGVVSRYGEIYPGTTYGSKRVKTGQKLGYIKWVGQGGVPPMLHFENYYAKNSAVKSGSLGGSKRINGRNSQRSQHLFNRTSFMKTLERNTFN